MTNTTKPPRPAILALPPSALRAVGRVRAFGRVKHPADDWRRFHAMEHMEAAVGHMLEAANGVTADLESGEHPLAHAACRLLMALEREMDPRPAQVPGCGGPDPGALT